MTSKARQKIDPNIRDFFDAEVDKPEHDKVLTALFQSNDALQGLITACKRLKPLRAFDEQSRFHLTTFGSTAAPRIIKFAEAVEKTGITPKWATLSPVRIEHKVLEEPLAWAPDGSRYSRLIGYIDVYVVFSIMGHPTVHQQGNGTFKWTRHSERQAAYFEVKGTWPTVGNLVRQLNLYKLSTLSNYGAEKPLHFVVGPDDSMNEVVVAHGYRLVTFDAAGSAFTLVDAPLPTDASASKVEGVF